ncbi:hypothetical protein EYF80_068158 [Liparis tanakae]|uniref:Uncharacterized protein n=1 Tax=Liparis tanakae TaxID=230148 RepID=A0A4Z2DZQ6_9TELE|nr:hypothetical protein EYF80_068158 [Liparis tanakae]
MFCDTSPLCWCSSLEAEGRERRPQEVAPKQRRWCCGAFRARSHIRGKSPCS